MQGRVDEAIASLEAAIAADPEMVSPRIKAAELYAREKRDARRAAEMFRDALKSPAITAGENIYATNRLVDLYIGPLEEPGRAMVELRRLIDTRPASAAADHARRSLAALKARTDIGSSQDS